MNFPVRTYGGKCIIRPDISFNRDSGDYYVPGDVNSIGFTPIIAAHLVKTGKMVSGQFAGRYYDSVTFGLLLYPAAGETEGIPDYCIGASSCFDNTTVIPQPLFSPVEFFDERSCFSITKDRTEIFHCNADGLKSFVAKAIVDCSNHSLIRKGDYVVAELEATETLCRRDEGDCNFKTLICGNITADIEIKF